MLRMRFIPLILVAIAALLVAGCGGDDSTSPSTKKDTGGGGGGSNTGLAGTWNSVNVSNGVPGSRYFFEVSSTPDTRLGEDDVTITGDAYYRWAGFLERVGPLSGTVAPDGKTTITVILDDNGWEGMEVMTGTFSNGVLRGDYSVTNTEGSVWDEGKYELRREPAPVELPDGTGKLGEGGLWRGSIFWASLSDCNATGYLVSIVFKEGAPASEDGRQYVPLTGTLSGRTHPGGEVPATLSAFQGPITATVTGKRFFSPEPLVEFDLSGGLSGRYEGGFNLTQSSTVLGGQFTNGRVCTDELGSTNRGLFVLVGLLIDL